MQPVRYCRNCGADVSSEDAFCASCGMRLVSGEQGGVPDGVEAARHGPAAESWFRSAVSTRDTVLGAVCGAVGVVGMLAVIYAILSVIWLSGGAAPGEKGLVGFVLLHGGGMTVEVPPVDALFGLGGSLSVDPPVTSFALLPLLVFMVLGWAVARRERTTRWGFVGGAALVYGGLVALLALLGTTSVEVSQGVTANISVAPVSAGIWGFLLAGIGATLGVSGARGPLTNEGTRRVIKGGLVAVIASAGFAIVLAGVLALAGGGPEAPQQNVGQEFGSPSFGRPTTEDFTGLSALVGGIFALLPAGIGMLWLLSNGLPVGVSNAPDLSSIPLVGEALQDVPLSVGLLGDWPLGWEWRLLLLAPVAGLALGGFVAGRGAPNPLFRGALVAVPYTLVAALVISLTRTGVGVSVAAVNADASFGASFAWVLLLLPTGVLLGALGGLLGRSRTAPTPRPMRTMVGAGVAGLFVLLLSFPVFLAPLSGGSGTIPAPNATPSPTPDFAFEETMPEAPDDLSEMSVPEFSSEPRDAGEVSAGDSSDPAFDSILPTLQEMTSSEIMLPAELPVELSNVAVDSTTGGQEYGVLFLAESPDAVVEDFVRAFTLGTLSSGPDLPEVEEDYFTSSNEETVELPDGTPATLRYLEPVGMSNASPFWEGRFEKNGQEYLLNLPYADPSGELARGLLTSMVPAAGDAEDTSAEESVEQRFISDYYEAVGRRDWTATYSMLDAATQQVYTEDEWVYVQEARESTSGAAPVTDATIADISGEGASFTATVELTYEDGTSATLPGIEVYFENGEFKRHLTNEELEFLEQF